MAEVKDIKAARRRRNSKKIVRRLIILGVTLVVIIGALVLRETVSRENFMASISDFFQSFGKGEGYPLTVPGSKTVQAISTDNGVAVLTQTQFFVYNKTGKELQSDVHGFSNPLMKRSGNKIIVYDRGGNGVKVYSKTKLLFSKTYENTVYGVEISKKYIAVTTSSRTHSAEVMVYTTAYREVMKWYCAEGRVTSICFDDSSSSMYASVVDANGGDYLSTVYKINASKKTEEKSVPRQGILALSLKSIDGKIAVIGEDRVEFLNHELSLVGNYSYGDMAMVSYSDKMEDHIVLALSHSENDRGGTIVMLDGEGKTLAKIDVVEEIESLDGYKNNIVYISGKKLHIYNIRKGTTKTEPTSLDSFAITAGRDGVYTLDVTQIEKTNY